jgi:hypothetical protein
MKFNSRELAKINKNDGKTTKKKNDKKATKISFLGS